MDFASIYNGLITIAVGFIGWSLKELYGQIREQGVQITKRMDEVEAKVSHIERTSAENYITRREHDRDINAIMQKFDSMMEILMVIKEDVGYLNGKNNERR